MCFVPVFLPLWIALQTEEIASGIQTPLSASAKKLLPSSMNKYRSDIWLCCLLLLNINENINQYSCGNYTCLIIITTGS